MLEVESLETAYGPSQVLFGVTFSIRPGEVMTLLGRNGMGTLAGPVVGAVVLLLLEDLLSGWTVHWQIILGPFLVLVVLFAKRGLFGLLPHGGPSPSPHG